MNEMIEEYRMRTPIEKMSENQTTMKRLKREYGNLYFQILGKNLITYKDFQIALDETERELLEPNDFCENWEERKGKE